MTEDQARAKLKNFLDKASHNHLQRTLDKITATDVPKKLQCYMRERGNEVRHKSSDNEKSK